MRHASRPEPHSSRGSSFQHREGDEPGLVLASDSSPCRHTGTYRYRAGERRSESEPARPAAVRSRRGLAQTDDGRNRQRDLRCCRRSHPKGPFPGRPCARRIESRGRVILSWHPASGTLVAMTRTHARPQRGGFLKRHALSIAAIGILLSWLALYIYSDPKTHQG